MERFANTATSSLSGAINNSVTSITIASTAKFPDSGNFRINVDIELMLVTAVSSNTFTVERGIEGTVAAVHNTGAVVTVVLTAGGLEAGIVDPAQEILDGTTGGTAIWSQPVQAPTYKKFACFLDSYENDSDTPQVITFPTPFVKVPALIASVDPQPLVSPTQLTLPSGMQASVTGWIILEGY